MVLLGHGPVGIFNRKVQLVPVEDEGNKWFQTNKLNFKRSYMFSKSSRGCVLAVNLLLSVIGLQYYHALMEGHNMLHVHVYV